MPNNSGEMFNAGAQVKLRNYLVVPPIGTDYKKSFDLSQASPHQSASAAAVQINYTPSRHKFQSISRLHCQWAPRVNLSIRPITFVLFVGHTSIHKFTSNRESRKKSQQGSERTMNFTGETHAHMGTYTSAIAKIESNLIEL